MTIECKGCNKDYSNGTWLHPELQICSICYSIHIHSEVKAWDEINEKWVDIALEKKKGALDKWL